MNRCLLVVTVATSLVMVTLICLSVASAADIEMMKQGIVRIVSKPPGQARKVGTGFIVQAKAGTVYILTASHVVAGEQHPMVEFYTGEKAEPLPAIVLDGMEGSDLRRGLALLSVKPSAEVLTKLIVLPFAPKEWRAQSGEDILIVGYPGDAFGLAVIRGNVVAERGRDLQIDANISEGASGSPVLKGAYVVGLLQERGATYSEGNRAGSLRDFTEGYNLGSLPSELQPSVTVLSQSRELPMVLVPAGGMLMGSRGADGRDDERPAHPVTLNAFYIDIRETTVAEYTKYLAQSGKARPYLWEQVIPERDGIKPVIGLSWNEAQAYCLWHGKRLPTEAEWEKAARGTEGRMFPWGNVPPTSNHATYSRMPTFNAYLDGVQNVGSLPQGNSPYGVSDMSGNAWEWVADWYGKDYYSTGSKENPTGPVQGEEKVLRGGSWLFGDIRSTARDSAPPTKAAETFGVRCAKDAK